MPRLHGEAHRLSAGRIIVSLRPAIRARHHLHPVRPQHMQFAQAPAGGHRLNIGISGDEQMPVKRFEQVRRAARRVRPCEQRQQRVVVDLASAVEQEQRHRRGGLGDHPHRAIDDRVLGEAFARQRRKIARRPHRLPTRGKRDQLRRPARLRLDPRLRLEQPPHPLTQCHSTSLSIMRLECFVMPGLVPSSSLPGLTGQSSNRRGPLSRRAAVTGSPAFAGDDGKDVELGLLIPSPLVGEG